VRQIEESGEVALRMRAPGEVDAAVGNSCHNQGT
jgi:hypothetical protein